MPGVYGWQPSAGVDQYAPPAQRVTPGPLNMAQYNSAAPAGYRVVGRKSLGAGLVGGLDYSYERVFGDEAYDPAGNLIAGYQGRPVGWTGPWATTTQPSATPQATPWGATAVKPRPWGAGL